MHQRLGCALIALLVLGAGATVAEAGEPYTEADGSFLIVGFSITPPKAGAPVGVRFSDYAGNDITPVGGNEPVTDPSKETKTTAVQLARGFKINASRFATCAEATLKKGVAGCPRGSRVGSGSAILDARPLVATRIRAKVVAFNGKTAAGKSALLVRADASVAGNPVSDVLPVEIKGPSGGFGPSFVLDNGPEPKVGERFLYDLMSLSLTIPRRTVRVGGRQVGYVEAASQCSGVWRFRQVNTSYGGAKQTAFDEVGCVP